MTRLVSVGHGTLAREELGALLREAGITRLVDVRRFPGSRRHPHVATDALSEWLPEYSVAYRWEPGLGGRRRVDRDRPEQDAWWRVEAFRAYAAYTRTAEFGEAFAGLLGDFAQPGQVAVMCSESLWWRCHRRLIADVAVLLHGIEVCHLDHRGQLTTHVPAEGARVVDGELRYDP